MNYCSLVIVYCDAVTLRKRNLNISVSSFEFLLGHASTNAGPFVLLTVYWPGSCALTELFFDELSAVFERLVTFGCALIVCGDFNIHVDNPDDVNAIRLSELLQSFGCIQHMLESTHNAGHTLDLVVTKNDTAISALCIDHAIVRFTLDVEMEHCSTHWVMHKTWHRLSIDAFASDLAASVLCGDLNALNGKFVDDLAKLYCSELTRLFDQHCPVVKVHQKDKQTTSCFDADRCAARRCARVAERHFQGNMLMWTDLFGKRN